MIQNKGRDIGPLLCELGESLDSSYEIYGHIHTKKSVLIGADQATRWRTFLLDNIIGGPKNKMIDTVIHRFIEEKDLGMVFPDDPNCVGWGDNYDIAQDIAYKLGIKELPNSFNFPIGTMFWARKGALKSLYEMGLSWEDLPEEPLGYDGTILHAIERLLPLIASSNGFKSELTSIKNVNR